ncbi:MAG: adenosine deaminase [Vampirovibrionales bacterium]|nr:adenosine deaminase [Vampirovibrionales bacterium]
MDDVTSTWLRHLPKAELHLHIEGTLEPDLMLTLAERNKIAIPYSSMDEIKAAYQFENLQSFLDIYYQGASVLKTEQDFYDLTWRYLLHAEQDGIVHTELFFDPQTHTDRGISFDTVIHGIHAALQEGQRKLRISSRLILCFLRHLPEAAAFETLKQAKSYKHWITAVGLDSSEAGHPPSKFEAVFKQARHQGYLTVAHAGEEGPASYMWEAIQLLKVKRIDHGVRCTEDPKLIQFLKETQLPLAMCPLSNVKLRVFDSLADHPIKTLLHQGLCVTVSSDDPAYFGGYLHQNLVETADALSLTSSDLIQLCRNSIQASFLTPSEKQHWLQRLSLATTAFQ